MAKIGTMIALAKALGTPNDTQVNSAVSTWLAAHPEATTTVTDGAITNAKLSSSFVTPGTAAAYSSSSTYAVGDYVFYNGVLYRCTTAITTAEAWTAAHWTAAVLGDDVGDLKSHLDNLKNGNDTLDGSWMIGVLDKTTVYPNLKYMVCNPTIQQYDRDIVFNIASGYYLNVNYFNEQGTRTAAHSNKTGTFTVPSGTRFNVSVTENPLDTSLVITDMTRFVNAVTFETTIEIRLTNLEVASEQYHSNFNDMKNSATFTSVPLEYGNIENGTGIIKDGVYVRTREYITAFIGDVVSASYTNYAGNITTAQLNCYEYDEAGNLIGGGVAGWKSSYTVTKNCNLMIVFNNNLTDQSSTSRRVSPSEFANIVTLKYTRSHYVVDGASIDIRDNKTIHGIKNTFLSDIVKTIAHRGDKLFAPECTAPAYILARKRGLKIAENDVFQSSDGVYVMWHDPTLSKLGLLVDINGYEVYTNGTVFYYYDASNSKLYTYENEYIESSVSVSSLTRCNGSNFSVQTIPFATLKRIDFGVYKNEQFAGTQILTFAEWVLLCKQLGMELYIDTKITYTDSIIEDLFEIVRKYGMVNFSSWLNIPFELIANLRTLDPQARIGILANPTAEYISAYAPHNVGRGCFFDGNATTLTQSAAELALEANIPVECYYVDFGDILPSAVYNVIKTVVSYGVSGITTDHYRVDEAFQYLY